MPGVEDEPGYEVVAHTLSQMVQSMEPLTALLAGPGYRLGETAAHDPVGILGPAD